MAYSGLLSGASARAYSGPLSGASARPLNGDGARRSSQASHARPLAAHMKHGFVLAPD